MLKLIRFARCGSLVWGGLLSLMVAGMLFSPALFAQNSSAGPSQSAKTFTVPLSVAFGRVFIPVYLVNQEKGLSSSISLEVSLEEPETIVIAGDEIGFIAKPDYEKIKNGESVFLDLILKPEMEVSIPFREVKYEASSERMSYAGHFTARYSKFMEEHKVKGRLGRGFFSKYRTVFDIAARTATFYPPTGEEITADAVLPFVIKKNRMRVDVEYGDGSTGSMILGSENYETYVDATAAGAAGKPAGDFGSVWLGNANSRERIDLMRYIAFRPYDFSNEEYGYDVMRPIATYVPRPQSFTKDEYESKHGATFVSGVNLLENFRIEFDWERSKIGLTSVGQPRYPVADLEFYKAELSGKAESMQTYLERYPESRLAIEAALKLMKWRMADKDATDDQLLTALKWIIDTAPPERKMEDAEGYVMRIARMPSRSHADFTLRAGALAASYSREAFVNHIVYRLHNYIGEAYIEKGDYKDAWRSILSAAFMPTGYGGPLDEEFDDKPVGAWHDLKVQINLATIYEKQGRIARAYSRYRQAAELINRNNSWFAVAAQSSAVEIEAMKPNHRRWCKMALFVMDSLERTDKQLSEDDRKMVAGH